MVKTQDIKKIVDSMTGDINENIKNIKKCFKTLDYVDGDEQSLLHIFCYYKVDEEKNYLAIKSLLELGMSPNLVDYFKYNFIQTALYMGYSQEFILNITKLALEHGLDLSLVDSDGDTILHTAIYSDDYVDSIVGFYNLLVENGFDLSITDNKNRTIMGAINYQLGEENSKEKKESLLELKELLDRNIIETAVKIDNKNSNIECSNVNEITAEAYKPNLSSETIEKLEEFGYLRSMDKFNNHPAVGRELELEKLIMVLAKEKQSPILVGESGVGKTAIVEELIYRIQHNEVPDFLKNQIIFEINPNELNAGCQYVGMFEKKIKEVMNLIIKNNLIVFIDEIHTIYGIGASSKNDNDFASQLRFYLDKFNIKVIGTTTKDEYEKYFSNSPIKRRFDLVYVDEPDKENLYLILEKVVMDKTVKNGIFLDSIEDKKEELFKILIQFTNKSNRVYNDNLNNPDLLILIIDDAYAYAKVESASTIEIEHFIKALLSCDRIGSVSKNKAIARLRSLETKKNEVTMKIIQFPKR